MDGWDTFPKREKEEEEMLDAKKWMEKVQPINALTFLLRFYFETILFNVLLGISK
jgi:hypothetical protein